MDKTTYLISSLVILAIVVAVSLFVLRKSKRLKAGFKGPTGMGFEVESDNSTGNVAVTGSKSHKGAIRARSSTGGNVRVSDSEAAKDIDAASEVAREPRPKV